MSKMKLLLSGIILLSFFFLAGNLSAQSQPQLSCDAEVEEFKISLEMWKSKINLKLQVADTTKSCQLEVEEFFRTGRFDEVYKVGFNGYACRENFADVFDIKVIKNGYIALTKNEKDTASAPSASMNLLNIGDTISCQRVEVKTSFFNLF